MNESMVRARLEKGITFGELHDILLNGLLFAGMDDRSAVNPVFSKLQVHGIFHAAIKDRDPAEVAASDRDRLQASNILREFGLASMHAEELGIML